MELHLCSISNCRPCCNLVVSTGVWQQIQAKLIIFFHIVLLAVTAGVIITAADDADGHDIDAAINSAVSDDNAAAATTAEITSSGDD
jgi:hypothetical protein